MKKNFFKAILSKQGKSVACELELLDYAERLLSDESITRE